MLPITQSLPSGSSESPTPSAPEGRVLSGWVGGWVGGDKKGPSIFLKFKYSNKQDVLIPNLASKVVYAY